MTSITSLTAVRQVRSRTGKQAPAHRKDENGAAAAGAGVLSETGPSAEQRVNAQR